MLLLLVTDPLLYPRHRSCGPHKTHVPASHENTSFSTYELWSEDHVHFVPQTEPSDLGGALLGALRALRALPGLGRVDPEARGGAAARSAHHGG